MTKNIHPIIVLFRQDLRLKDNPALTHACETGCRVIPLYILDDQNPGKWKMGGASRWWLHHSLASLDQSLREKGSQLFYHKGETISVIKELIKKYQVTALYWNRCYEPYAISLEQKLKNLLPESQSFNGSLLFEPWEISNKQGEPFKVFTPFWNKCMEVESIDNPLPKPSLIPTQKIESESLETLDLLPKHPDWSQGISKNWKVGERSAQNKLDRFIKENIKTYENDRNIPSLDATSVLSPHLHFGEISPRQIFHAAPKDSKFISEIGWREFSYYQLYHFPKLPEMPWRSEFLKFPWDINLDRLKKWQKGETGYPIVDAGMRQLWEMGWMHNRVRMIVASFLVKDLLIPWQKGAEWFWDTLVDADLASNSSSWQWVAGCGFDAAPFFRIFNPTLQGKKFDPEGTYIKRWIPELANVPKSAIHTPWIVSESLKLDYPNPIVDHDIARKKALEAFKRLIRK